MNHDSGSSIALLAFSPALVMLSTSFQAARKDAGIPWGVWVLVAVALLLALWWWLNRGFEKVSESMVAVQPAPGPKPSAADDLKVVEGIGPKISSLLNRAGITTCAQLAATDVSRLQEILDEVRLSGLADPTTWPEQAKLAAGGQWEALKALQAELKGGRRV